METAKYLCEFFFENFWHFIMLLLLCLAISPKITNNSTAWNTDTTDDE